MTQQANVNRPDSLICTACYVDHPSERYNTNPLIRALPPLPTFEKLQELLTTLPPYSRQQRSTDRTIREHYLQQLFRIFLALPRVVDLLISIHAMICEGYMGRAPMTQADMARRQLLYEMRQRGEFFPMELGEGCGEFAAALIGISGAGKTQALRRIAKFFPAVIFHPDLHIYQIPVLHIEMPYKGVSINALAQAIIRKIDKLFPEGDYIRVYLSGRKNAEVLFMDAVFLMQIHYVGILLVDESENREYRSDQSRRPTKSIKGQEPLATLLITATDTSETPMLMCGTPELDDILGHRMSRIRRSEGRGMRVWKPLTFAKPRKSGEETELGEFDVVLEMIWSYQWTKSPFELTTPMRNLFYFYTQGIIDIVIKLFHDVQLRAIRNGGGEIVDENLIHEVARDELHELTKLAQILREMDYERAAKSTDLAAYLRIVQRMQPPRPSPSKEFKESKTSAESGESGQTGEPRAGVAKGGKGSAVSTGGRDSKATKSPNARTKGDSSRNGRRPPPKPKPSSDVNRSLDGE